MLFDYHRGYQRYKKYYFKSLRSYYYHPLAKASLSLVLTLATISFFALFALKPTLVTIAGLAKEIETQKQINQKLEQKVNALSQAQLAFTQAQPSLPLIDKTLPREADFLRFVQQLDYLGYQGNLVLSDARFGQFNLIISKKNSLSPAIGEIPEKAIELSFSFNLDGSWQNLKNFLQSLENLERIVVIDKISWLGQSGTEGAELQINLSGKVFYLPEEK